MFKKSLSTIVLFIAYLLLLTNDALANSIDLIHGDAVLVAVICKVINIFTGPAGQALVIVVIITSGVSMFFGKMTWVTAAIVVIGVGCMFGAENIVNEVFGGSLKCKQYREFII